MAGLIRRQPRVGALRFASGNLASLASSSTAAAASLHSLVVVEHKEGQVAPGTFSTVTAAAKIGGPVSLLVAGLGVQPITAVVKGISGVQQVLVADAATLQHSLAEPMAGLLYLLQQRREFTHILAPSTTFGRNFLPRAAALLDAQPTSDVIAILDEGTVTRPIYAGNALQTVRYPPEGPRLMTVRTSAFQAALLGGAADIESVSDEELAAAEAAGGQSKWVGEETSRSERPELSAAKVVIAGGRGLKSAEAFRMLEALADRLGGAVGASRAAVDAGYVPNDMQVGQTGKIVAPQLYIGCGISGAIQHLAGMKDSKCIVAINSDPDAPIFQVADYGLAMDLFEALPALQKELDAFSGK